MLDTTSPQPLTAAPPLSWRLVGRPDSDVFTVLARHYADDVLTTSLVEMDVDRDFYVHGCAVIRGERLDEDTARELVQDVARYLANGPTRWCGDGGAVRS